MNCDSKAFLQLTDGRDDGDGVKERAGERPRLRVLALLSVPAFLLRDAHLINGLLEEEVQ